MDRVSRSRFSGKAMLLFSSFGCALHRVYPQPGLVPCDIETYTFGLQDISTVLSRMCDVVIARVFARDSVYELAEHAHCPVINALCDMEHPCQVERANDITLSDGHCDTEISAPFNTFFFTRAPEMSQKVRPEPETTCVRITDGPCFKADLVRCDP